MQKKFLKQTFYGCIFVFFEVILIKLVQYKVLPAKYFYDSGHILAVMNGSDVTDIAYTYTANFFNKVNIFHLNTLQEWSWVIGIIFAIVIVIVLLQQREYNKKQYIFIYASIGLLSIYAFNLSKDIIQFLYFFLIYLVLSSNFSNIKKLILSCLILVYEALNFRIYFIIMATIMVTTYFVYIKFIKNKSLNKKAVTKIIIFTLVAFFIEVFAVQMVSNQNYNAIVLARSNVNQYRENDTDAVTKINEPLGVNTNFGKFIGNYLINMIRMMMPVELLLKGIKYIPFIIYQVFVTYNIIKLAKSMDDDNILWLSTVISFMMISVIFEPDFGSFVRHESALVLFLLKINIFNNKKGNELVGDDK